jgi:hypothetical protein
MTSKEHTPCISPRRDGGIPTVIVHQAEVCQCQAQVCEAQLLPLAIVIIIITLIALVASAPCPLPRLDKQVRGLHIPVRKTMTRLSEALPY